MATPHVCRVDCDPQVVDYGNGQTGTAHMMHAAEPSSAAGRYQWEQNRAILDAGRRAWRASGQGQSRECRAWDERRRVHLATLRTLADEFARRWKMAEPRGSFAGVGIAQD